MPPGTFLAGPLSLADAALFTDLYELTMAAAYFRRGMHGRATFSLFVRRLPPQRGFLVAAGLEAVLAYLQAFRFSSAALAYLERLGRFPPEFLAFLEGLRFTGEVRAVPEGTILFADEPLLEVSAPIIEAQLVETAVLNFCHLETLLASKAARAVLAARGRPVIDFGLRRTHGVDAGLRAARAGYLAGFAMTSNVLAAATFGLRPTGTMAHSYVSAFPHELDAFRAFAEVFPDQTVLLLDTYDTVAAAHKAVRVARELEARGHRLAGVRLDSGDLVALSRAVRDVLDRAGLHAVRILASGGLDETEIERMLEAGAPIDAFAVGTRTNVSADAPYLDIAYKLVRYDGRDVLKVSPGKETWAGEKQVYRRRDAAGRLAGDVLALREEPPLDDAEPLLEPVMAEGRPLEPPPPLDSLRARCQAQLAALPPETRRLRDPVPVAVVPSPRLRAHQQALRAAALAAEAGVDPA